MNERIELLEKLGLSHDHAVAFIKGIAQEAFEDGYSEGMVYEPAIVGESLGNLTIGLFTLKTA